MTIKEHAQQLLEFMLIEPDNLEVEEGEDYVFVTLQVDEDDAGKMIGNRGETIRAFGQVLTLSFYDQLEEKRIVVDVNDYKGRKEEQATEEGYAAADKARETQRPVDLPPMAAYERRVIHQALSEEEGVYTRSEGEGQNRRLVVYPDSYKIESESK